MEKQKKKSCRETSEACERVKNLNEKERIINEMEKGVKRKEKKKKNEISLEKCIRLVLSWGSTVRLRGAPCTHTHTHDEMR